MKILLKIMLIMSVYSIKENLAETTTTTTTPKTPLNEVKKIKRGVIGLTNVQPPSGHFHYYPFAHSQHSNSPQQHPQTNTQQSFNQQNIKPVQDNTPDSQFTYQNPQQILPQDNSNPNGYIGSLEHQQQSATISPYFPIAPLSDSTHPQQYSPTNHYAASSTAHFEPGHPQPAAQFPVHVEPAYVVASNTQQRIPAAGHYHSTVQHYPAYWNGNPQFPPQQQPIKYPTLLNGNKPQLYQPQQQQQSQAYPVNNPGSVGQQQFLTNKNYYPQNSIKHYNQANLATASPVKYTLSSVLPLSYTTLGPLSAHVKNHPLLLSQYKKTAPNPVKTQKEQKKSKKEELEYDDDKSEEKSEDIEEDDEPSPRRKPKYNSYRSKNYDSDDDDYYPRYSRYNDDSDDDDDYTSSIRDDRDDDEEADTAATSFKLKTKYNKKNNSGKIGNNKYNTKNNRGFSKSNKSNVQKSSNYKPKSKTDIIEGKYSQQVPVTTDQKSKSHYQANWYTYSSVNNNED